VSFKLRAGALLYYEEETYKIIKSNFLIGREAPSVSCNCLNNTGDEYMKRRKFKFRLYIDLAMR